MDRLSVEEKPTIKSAMEVPPSKLDPGKESPYQVIKAHGNPTTIDVKRLHYTVSIDKLNLASETTTQAESFAVVDNLNFVGDTGNPRE